MKAGSAQTESCCVYVKQENYSTHAWHNSIIGVWLLGRSSCSSPSTKELHEPYHPLCRRPEWSWRWRWGIRWRLRRSRQCGVRSPQLDDNRTKTCHCLGAYSIQFNASTCNWYFFKNGPTPASFSFIFGPFQTNIITIFTTNIWGKNVHPVYGAGIRTHDLWNVSLFPLPLDQGSRPVTDIFRFYKSEWSTKTDFCSKIF